MRRVGQEGATEHDLHDGADQRAHAEQALDAWTKGLSLMLDELEDRGVPVVMIGEVPGYPASFPRERLSVPVSYTHLRAHETVLDIVCRLLLEKKKEHK